LISISEFIVILVGFGVVIGVSVHDMPGGFGGDVFPSGPSIDSVFFSTFNSFDRSYSEGIRSSLIEFSFSVNNVNSFESRG